MAEDVICRAQTKRQGSRCVGRFRHYPAPLTLHSQAQLAGEFRINISFRQGTRWVTCWQRRSDEPADGAADAKLAEDAMFIRGLRIARITPKELMDELAVKEDIAIVDLRKP